MLRPSTEKSSLDFQLTKQEFDSIRNDITSVRDRVKLLAHNNVSLDDMKQDYEHRIKMKVDVDTLETRLGEKVSGDIV
jgi:hypothetical protein